MSSTGLLNNQLAGANEMSSATQVIWGTNINASEVQSKLKNFIQSFVEMKDDEDEDEQNDDHYLNNKPYYMEKLQEIKEMEETVL
jgi:esterase/lipase